MHLMLFRVVITVVDPKVTVKYRLPYSESDFRVTPHEKVLLIVNSFWLYLLVLRVF